METRGGGRARVLSATQVCRTTCTKAAGVGPSAQRKKRVRGRRNGGSCVCVCVYGKVAATCHIMQMRSRQKIAAGPLQDAVSRRFFFCFFFFSAS